MKKLKGPELKMPELKVPDFLADLYYDLRDRRLLPLVALVVVAIAAVPFLLGGDVEQPQLPDPGAEVAALEASAGKTSRLTVVEATPGLRDYHKRLQGRVPTDPFEQHFTGSADGSASSSSSGDSSGSSSPPEASGEESGTPESAPSGEAESGGGSSGGSSNGRGSSNGGGSSNGNGSNSGGAGKSHLVLFDYAIDARISRPAYFDENGSAQQPEPIVRHRVLPQTPLPGGKEPVVTYMGPGRKEGNKATGKVLLLVSADVQSISGEYHCVSGDGNDCQLLEVEPGFPLSFTYGDNEARYTINVLKVELVVTGHT